MSASLIVLFMFVVIDVMIVPLGNQSVACIKTNAGRTGHRPLPLYTTKLLWGGFILSVESNFAFALVLFYFAL